MRDRIFDSMHFVFMHSMYKLIVCTSLFCFHSYMLFPKYMLSMCAHFTATTLFGRTIPSNPVPVQYELLSIDLLINNEEMVGNNGQRWASMVGKNVRRALAEYKAENAIDHDDKETCYVSSSALFVRFDGIRFCFLITVWSLAGSKPRI